MFFCIYKDRKLLTFGTFASATTPSSVLFCSFVKFQDQSFHIQKGSHMNLYYRFI